MVVIRLVQLGLIGLTFQVASAQSGMDPGEPFGSPNGKKELQQAIFQGDSALYSGLIQKLKTARGSAVGMAVQEPFYRKPDSTNISEEEVEKIWNGVVDQWLVWEPNCPETSLEAPLAILALAMGSQHPGFSLPAENLRNLASLLENQQFRPERVGTGTVLQTGSFGVVNLPPEDACATTGSSQRLAQIICKTQANLCLTYSSGMFSGKSFVVADQSKSDEFFDGQLTHYQAFGILEMLHSFASLGDSVYLKSALLAGEWCLKEIPLAHTVYTSRLVWSFAALYEATGDPKWRRALTKLVHTYIVPSVLMDTNGDGLVDGADGISFSDLVPYSTKPGRMWDGQNASAWNSAISAHALLLAYSSFRSQKDSVEANRLKPCLLAMMENLCFEINSFGTPPSGSGFRDLAFAVLDIHYHLAFAEGISKPEWEKAIRILWNSRVVQKGGEFSVNVGQFNRYLHPQWPYRSLKFRVQRAGEK